MISTVTTVTTTTVVTIGIGAILGVLSTLLLIFLLAVKNVVVVGKGRIARALSRTLDVGIAPLLIAFLLMVVLRILEVL